MLDEAIRVNARRPRGFKPVACTPRSRAKDAAFRGVGRWHSISNAKHLVFSKASGGKLPDLWNIQIIAELFVWSFTEAVMSALDDDDNDFGKIVIAAVATTLVLGAIIYFYNNGDDAIQSAFRLPFPIDKTVPTITPSGPEI